MTICDMSAFAVAIGAKAGIAFCAAYVCFLTLSGHQNCPPSSVLGIVATMCAPDPLGDDMRRRAFLSILGSAVVSWPLAVRAQGERVRRIGIVMPFPPTNAEMQARVRAF